MAPAAPIVQSRKRSFQSGRLSQTVRAKAREMRTAGYLEAKAKPAMAPASSASKGRPEERVRSVKNRQETTKKMA